MKTIKDFLTEAKTIKIIYIDPEGKRTVKNFNSEEKAEEFVSIIIKKNIGGQKTGTVLMQDWEMKKAIARDGHIIIGI